MDTSIKIVVNPKKCQLCMSEELLIHCINFITTIKMLIQQIDENEISVTGNKNGTKWMAIKTLQSDTNVIMHSTDTSAQPLS